jgi:hypothetical protein
MEITSSQANELLKDINTEEELRSLVRKLDVGISGQVGLNC